MLPGVILIPDERKLGLGKPVLDFAKSSTYLHLIGAVIQNTLLHASALRT